MKDLETICQEILTRQLSPAENRVDVSFPIEDSEPTYRILGVSLAPKYSPEQLRGIERIKAKHELDLQYSRTYAIGETKSF